jgi:uncharacterized protein YndB with AHSA1/START domain
VSESIGPTNTHTVQIERLLPGPVELVWEYLTQTDLLATWLGEGYVANTPGGGVDLRIHERQPAESSAAESGAVESRPAGVLGRISGTVIRADPPRLLEFTWNTANDRVAGHNSALNDAAVVTFELEPQGDRVRLVLTHRRIARATTETTAITCTAGWQASLDVLAMHVQAEHDALTHFLGTFADLRNIDQSERILVLA